MLTLAHLYTRTPAGRSVAFNPFADLHPPLRSLLKAVCGKMATADLVSRFVHLGNVEHLLLQLEASGLIAARNAHFGVAPHAHNPVEVTSATASWNAPTTVPDNGQPHEVSAESTARSGVTPQAAEWASTASSALDEPSAPEHDPLTDAVLTRLVDWMATFVLTNMPEKSLTELTAIEKIRTPQQLIADLPRYEALVKQLGPVGTQHIDELGQIIVHLLSIDPATQTQPGALS